MAAEARGFAFNVNHNFFRVLDAWNASDQAIAKISTERGQANQFHCRQLLAMTISSSTFHLFGCPQNPIHTWHDNGLVDLHIVTSRRLRLQNHRENSTYHLQCLEFGPWVNPDYMVPWTGPTASKWPRDLHLGLYSCSQAKSCLDINHEQIDHWQCLEFGPRVKPNQEVPWKWPTALKWPCDLH